MNAQERALAKAKEKVEEILWKSPEGVSISALTGTLRISKPLAISALAALGAVEQNGVWVLPDDEVVEPEQVAPGAKADMAVVNENFTTELSGNSGELPKAFDQSVFVGLPSSAKWATVNIDGTGEAWAGVPDRLGDGTWDAYGQCFSLGGGFDGSKWRDSIIQREPVTSVDTVNPVSEQKHDDVACSNCIDQPYVYQNPIANQFYQESKSDYAKVLDVMLTKVLNAVKDNGGATIGRICELVDMYPDDVPDCVDILVDNGQLISRPLYFTTVYEVAA